MSLLANLLCPDCGAYQIGPSLARAARSSRCRCDDAIELTPLGREMIDNPPRGGNAAWIHAKEEPCATTA